MFDGGYLLHRSILQKEDLYMPSVMYMGTPCRVIWVSWVLMYLV